MKRSSRVLAIIPVYAVAGGAAFAWLASPEGEAPALAMAWWGLGMHLLSHIWVRYDAMEREFRMSQTLKLGVFLLIGVGLAIYFLRSRGLRGVVSTLIAAAYFAALLVCFVAGAVLAAVITPA